MRTLFFFLLLVSCNQALVVDCDTDNYFTSPYENNNSSFQNQQREIVTSLSEKQLNETFNQTEISCKDLLSIFFYCNICFNSNTNYLISYNGDKFDLENVKDPQIFTNNVINLISSMSMGSEEYEAFLKSQKNSFSKQEEEWLKNHFRAQKKDTIVKSIKIKTH